MFFKKPQQLPSKKTTSAGSQAEQVAFDYLLTQGLTALTRNFRSRFGEIDLIMHDGKVLVFVEVRFRSNANFGSATATVGLQKQQKIQKTARVFLQQQHSVPACRFDVVGITHHANNKSNQYCVNWVKNAFS